MKIIRYAFFYAWFASLFIAGLDATTNFPPLGFKWTLLAVLFASSMGSLFCVGIWKGFFMSLSEMENERQRFIDYTNEATMISQMYKNRLAELDKENLNKESNEQQ